MNWGSAIHRPMVVRTVISLLLGAAALGLFMLNRISLLRHDRSGSASTASRQEPRAPGNRPDLSPALGDLDREVDSVLIRFGIQSSWIRKKTIAIPNADFPRIERRVLLPSDIATVSMNAAFNTMAKRYNGRAVASENLKENYVTIHIETGGSIVQTIILRPTANLRRAGRKSSLTRA
ncbi:MAG: hypothetical protein AUI33_04420 [Ignavibacteria bacterium 13_1_40CM_2_61_4]|nr:MAG: hypothetical protein AUI33_04420 [Ignavibacteria bacterium 13_1_40CM_2_61_4]